MSTSNRNSASLGRGLDALFPNDFVNIKKVETGGSSSISELPLDAIYPNPDQPRRDFDAETLEELATRVGKKRATVANYLRLLKLPAQIQLGLKNKKLTMGHARALLSIEDTELQLALYKQILSDDLSVRDVEQMAREYSTSEPSDRTKSQEEARRAAKERLAQYRSTTDQISRIFGTKVKMSCNAAGKGRITIPFASDDQLQEILSMLSKL